MLFLIHFSLQSAYYEPNITMSKFYELFAQSIQNGRLIERQRVSVHPRFISEITERISIKFGIAVCTESLPAILILVHVGKT
jgi:hypothetical protein